MLPNAYRTILAYDSYTGTKKIAARGKFSTSAQTALASLLDVLSTEVRGSLKDRGRWDEGVKWDWWGKDEQIDRDLL